MDKTVAKNPANHFICPRCHTSSHKNLEYFISVPVAGNSNTYMKIIESLCLSCWFIVRENFRNSVYY